MSRAEATSSGCGHFSQTRRGVAASAASSTSAAPWPVHAAFRGTTRRSSAAGGKSNSNDTNLCLAGLRSLSTCWSPD